MVRTQKAVQRSYFSHTLTAGDTGAHALGLWWIGCVTPIGDSLNIDIIAAGEDGIDESKALSHESSPLDQSVMVIADAGGADSHG